MRLSRLQRGGFFVLGVVAAAVAGWAYSRSEMTLPGLFAFLPGLILIVGAGFGTAPNLTFKDTKVEWPKGDEPKVEAVNNETKTAVDQLKAELAKTNERLTESEKLLTEQGDTIEETMAALKYVSDRLDDYILAHEPAPDDDLSDEDRLSEMRQQLRDLQMEATSANFHGERDAVQLADARDRVGMDLAREVRRQRAQYTFGMRDKPPESSD